MRRIERNSILQEKAISDVDKAKRPLRDVFRRKSQAIDKKNHRVGDQQGRKVFRGREIHVQVGTVEFVNNIRDVQNFSIVRTEKSEAPSFQGKLSDGRDVLIVGDVKLAAINHHEQGKNGFGYQGTCSFVAMEGMLRQAGIYTNEHELVKYAINHKLCDTLTVDTNAELAGGNSPLLRQEILEAHGAKDLQILVVRGDIQPREMLVEKLAQVVEQGRSVGISMNAGVLYDSHTLYGDGSSNHALHVTGVMRDLHTKCPLGIFVNDGNVVPGGTFIETEKIARAFNKERSMLIESIGRS